MKEEQKVYIKGVPGRGKEVIKALTKLGGGKRWIFDGEDDDCVYFINHTGEIDHEHIYTEKAKIIMDNYREIELPKLREDGDKLWEDGDILIRKDRIEYLVFSKYSYNTMFYNYDFLISIDEENHIWFSISGEDKLYKTEDFRLATSREIKQFYNLLHEMGEDWDSEKKHLVKWKCEPILGIFIG